MAERISIDELFDRRLTYPDQDARKRFSRLVGIDDAKSQLMKLLGVLVNPAGVRAWASQYHKNASTLLDYVQRQPPLVILAGDVGAGKTELAESVGDAVARQEKIDVTLFPLSLATRGSGMVGEMSQLLSAAFDSAIREAEKLSRGGDRKATGAIILLIDEGDSLTESRQNQHMHHEDRAGVNAFIRGVDQMARKRLPLAVVLCTNRLTAIDPAVRRRAADVFEFGRPNAEQRRTVLAQPLEEIGFKDKEIAAVVQMTGASTSGGNGFTFSDLTQRLIPTLVLDAYPDRPITFSRAVELIGQMRPTPPFGHGGVIAPEARGNR